jgi:hypothetical protein
MLMLASSSSSPSHRGSIERRVDGGDHRIIGGRAGKMGGDRLQEMIALSDRQRCRRALQQPELLIREREGTRCCHGLSPVGVYARAPAQLGLVGFARVAQRQIDRLGLVVLINAAVEQIIPEMVRHLAQRATNSVSVIIVTVAAVIHGVPAGAMGVALQ